MQAQAPLIPERRMKLTSEDRLAVPRPGVGDEVEAGVENNQTFGRAYTEVMESFFGSEKTSSSNYVDKEGEEEKDSSSSSDEEVQRNKPPSPLLQSPAPSKKQSKKSSKSKDSKFLSESKIVPSGPGVPLPNTRDSSSLNVLRERVKQNNMVDPLPIFLPISVIERPPVDAHTGERPLENKDPRVAIKQIPLDFEQFLSRCRLERVEEMSTFVTPRSYTLVIADTPYGFCAPNSVNDNMKYGVSAYKKVIEAFGKVITCDSWSLVFFHAHDQITATQKVFTDSNMTCQMLTWINPNIHGYKLYRFSWAWTGTTTVSALKRGRNVIAVECDPLQVKFIEQRVTALKELPDEFQEVGMKSMVSDPRFFDASGEPQRQIGSEKVGEIVDLVGFEPDNVEVEEQASDTLLQITSMGEETRNEEKEDLPIQA
ncbi:hypothetical protein L7F22_046140 [Adiantum nelumboides]|nr:hypothetical protein [Adiantum nelumboides]